MFKFDIENAILNVKAAKAANPAKVEPRLATLATLAGGRDENVKMKTPEWIKTGVSAPFLSGEIVRHVSGRLAVERSDGILLTVNQAKAQSWLQ